VSSRVEVSPVLVAIPQSGQRRKINYFAKEGNWPREYL